MVTTGHNSTSLTKATPLTPLVLDVGNARWLETMTVSMEWGLKVNHFKSGT